MVRTIGRLFQFVAVCVTVFLLISSMGILVAMSTKPHVISEGDWWFFGWIALAGVVCLAVGLALLKIADLGEEKKAPQTKASIRIEGNGFFFGVHYTRLVYLALAALAVCGSLLPWESEIGVSINGLDAHYGWIVMGGAALLVAAVSYDILMKDNGNMRWWSRVAGVIVLLALLFEFDYMSQDTPPESTPQHVTHG